MNDKGETSRETRATADHRYAPAVLPLPQHVSPARWCRRAAVWIVIAAATAAAVRYDLYLTAWGQRYLDWLPEHVLVSFRDFGQVTPIIVVTAALACYERRRLAIVITMTVAAAFVGIAQGLGKLFILRWRPFTPAAAALNPDDWRGLWVGLGWNPRPFELQSFPSGHTCLAFAFAGILSWYYPRARWIFWTMAVACGFSRYIERMHWVSDCIAGGALGYLCAWITLRPYVWALPVIWWNRRRRARRRRLRIAVQAG